MKNYATKQRGNDMKMPPEIAKSVVKVTLEVEGLVKDQDNNFAKYRFVSHDQIKMKAGKLMAKHGLIIVANEVESEVRDKSLAQSFDFWIYHETGSEYGPIRRTVQVPATGAQAYGTACSYAQKYFLRDIFQIPTGEQEDEGVLPKQHDLAAKKSSAPTQLITDASSAKIRDDLLDTLMTCKTKEEAGSWAEKNSQKKQLMNKFDQQAVTDAYYDLLDSFLPPKKAKEA